MIHQAVILQIVFTQFSDIVAERLTTCEKLLIGAKTTIERMTHGVDDFDTGQHNPQQADKNKVVWILVDEVRCTGAKLARGFNVVIPDFAPVLCRQLEQVIGK